LCEVIAGQSPDGRFYNSEGNGMPFYQGKKDFGEKFIGDPTTWTMQVTKIARKGDILMSMRAPVGPVNFATDEICIGRGLGAIRSKPELNRDFLFYQLLLLQPEIAGKEGAVFASINKSEIEALPISFAPLPEQQRIVGILDGAFDGIATAKANAEKNMQNARALFESHLQAVFSQLGQGLVKRADTGNNAKIQAYSMSQETSPRATTEVDLASNSGRVTKTGGRNATLRHIPGELSLAVGMPSTRSRKGWCWNLLTDLARLESGHTPSRRHPEYWGGSIPWIGIQDARENHGQRITDTSQTTNALGIENSSARVLPQNTVCLSRTASVGYVVVMGRPMATSQDFVNWVCSSRLLPDFLKYLFLAEGRDGLLRYASGAIHQTIYFPEAKAFHICHPETEEQLRIVRQCDVLSEETQRLESIYKQKLAALEELKKSLLHQAFSGQL
jgi:type I restriction enzyme, S subunit